LAIAANKSDMYENEEVTEKEGKALARKYDAIFQTTTAKEDNGSIDELFINISKKFLNPNIKITSNLTKKEMKKKSIKLDQQKLKEEKEGGCC
jgi:GTPase SAR1 family protein